MVKIYIILYSLILRFNSIDSNYLYLFNIKFNIIAKVYMFK